MRTTAHEPTYRPYVVPTSSTARSSGWAGYLGQTFALNLCAAVRTTLAALPALTEARGTVVNVNSLKRPALSGAW
jgi:hypothetical protein